MSAQDEHSTGTEMAHADTHSSDQRPSTGPSTAVAIRSPEPDVGETIAAPTPRPSRHEPAVV